MNQNTDKIPAISKTDFNCPHCSAYSAQNWGQLYTKRYSENMRTPDISYSSIKWQIENNLKITDETKATLIEWVDKMMAGKPFIMVKNTTSSVYQQLENLYISKCYNCKEITVWCHDKIIYPASKVEILPNQDLPHHITKLFEEARDIVGVSPKGAAALLRLCIQYLCKELGGSGKNIDKDIAVLVSKGLNPVVQKALDVVRVIGNESVHPAKMDSGDTRVTALNLFDLVNLIAEQMITHPKQVEYLYGSLPEGKLQSIEQRNEKARKENT